MNKLLVRHRIPTSQFAYIEFEKDYEDAKDALAENEALIQAYSDQGLPAREWAQVRNKMLVTAEFDPNIMDRLSKAQRWFVNELKLALRANKAEEPVID